MGSSPHVCFADELQQDHHEHNNNAAGNNKTKKWLLELEPSSSSGHGGHSPCSSSMSISPTPRYERNMGFFQLLSRRFGLRSSDDLVQDAAALEEDAHSSSTDSYSSIGRGLAAGNGSNISHTTRLEQMSCASSETSSTIDIEEQQLEQQQLQQQQRKLSRTSFSRLQRRSTSSLRRAFESLSLTSRSLSCSGPSPPPPPPPPPAAAMPLKSALKSASNIELHQQQQQQQQQQRQHRLASKSTSSSSACSTSSSSSTASKSKQKPPPQRILRQPVSYTYLKGMSGLPTQRVPRSSVCCQYARR